MPDAFSGVRFASIPSLPSASDNANKILEKGGLLYYSNGAQWLRLQTTELIGNLFTNAKPYTFIYKNAPIGTTDLGGPATGKRWRVFYAMATNTTASATARLRHKISGTYYGWKSATTMNNGTTSASALVQGIDSFPILEAGEQIAFTVTGGAMCLFVSIIEYDVPADGSGLKSVKLLSLNTGDNTLYTCPSGYRTRVWVSTHELNADSTYAGSVYYRNESGASVTVYPNLVASGGSPGAIGAGSNAAIAAASAVANNGQVNQSIPPYMEAGDYVSFNVTATSVNHRAFLTLSEIKIL